MLALAGVLVQLVLGASVLFAVPLLAVGMIELIKSHW